MTKSTTDDVNEELRRRNSSVFTISSSPLDVTTKQKSKFDFIKNCFCVSPRPVLRTPLLWILIAFLFWGFVLGISRTHALPGGNIFSILILYLCSAFVGKLAEILRCPNYIGMLLAGFTLRNIEETKLIITDNLNEEWSLFLKSAIFTLFLLRLHAHFNWKDLEHFGIKYTAITLAIIPCLLEILTVMCLSLWIFKLNVVLSFLLGVLISSSACYGPSRKKCFTTERQRLMLAFFKCVQELDNTISVFWFSILVSIFISIYSESSNFKEAKVILGISGNILGGIFVGLLLWIFPESSKPKIFLPRFLMCFFGAFFPIAMSTRLKYPGAGIIGSICFIHTVMQGWRSQNWAEMKEFSNLLDTLWEVCLPLLFGLTGSSLAIEKFNLNVTGWSCVLFIVTLIIRFITAFALCPENENRVSKIYISLIMLSKVSGQIILGSFLYDVIKNQAMEQHFPIIFQIFSISILVVIFTSPFYVATKYFIYPSLVWQSHHKQIIDKIQENHSYYNILPIIEEEEMRL